MLAVSRGPSFKRSGSSAVTKSDCWWRSAAIRYRAVAGHDLGPVEALPAPTATRRAPSNSASAKGCNRTR